MSGWLVLGLAVVFGVVVLLSAVILLGRRVSKNAAVGLASLRASGHPGRVQEILALDDARAAPALSNHVFFVRMQEQALERLTDAERVFRLADEVLLEVNNGGFLQYFENSAGDHAAEAVAALRTIGAAQTAALLEEACGVFAGSRPASAQTARLEQVAALTPEARARLTALDERFYAEDDAAARLLPFVRERQAEFLDQ